MTSVNNNCRLNFIQDDYAFLPPRLKVKTTQLRCLHLIHSGEGFDDEKHSEKRDSILSELKSRQDITLRHVEAFAEKVCESAEKGKPLVAEDAIFDQKLLPLYAEMENSRHPGLNLIVCKCAQEAHDLIRDKAKAGKDENVSIIFPSNYIFDRSKNKLVYGDGHHSLIDAHFHADSPPNFLFVESERTYSYGFLYKYINILIIL